MPEVICLHKNAQEALKKSISVLNDGGIIVFPTDTVYGLAAKYDQLAAIQKIYQVKDRDQTKALAVLISSIEQVELISTGLSKNAEILADRFWPGALTIVVEKRLDLKTPLSQDNSIGIRIPNDNFVRELAKHVGPLATTSANRSGYPNTININEVNDQIGELVDLIIDGGDCNGKIPSTVVDCRREELVILREGAISKQDLLSSFII